jgi:putative spermidine/putrescine transport system ATP-binding protein
MQSQALSIENLSVRYGGTSVIERLTLRVEPGEFLTLLGPSGSGKTSLLMSIAGFVPVSAGSIRFGETELSSLPPHRRNLGVVFQSYALFPHMSVFGNVAFPLRLRKVRPDRIRERVESALALMKMEQFAERGVHELSGGQRQRVALARAVVFEPAIMLMDEPLSALDRKLREHMQLELRRLHERLGVTTIYVTHDQREALTMSDRIVVMERGRIVQTDTPQSLYGRPRSRFVADFIGMSSFLPVTATANGVSFGEHRWSSDGADVPDLPGGKGFLVLRPETLCVLEGHDRSFNTLPAILRSASYEGDAIFLEADAERGVTLKVRVPIEDNARIPAPGTSLLLGWRPQNTVLVPESDR